MLYKEDWDKTKERMKAFWERELVDRCCVAIMAPKEGRPSRNPPPPDDEKELYSYWTDVERVLKRYIETIESTFYGGDALPLARTYLGTGIAAAFFGSKPTFSKNTVWFSPFIHDWDKDGLEFDENNRYWKLTKEMAAAFSEYGKGKFLVDMSDVSSALDILAHMRGTEDLLVDLMMEPERVSSALDIVTDKWTYINETLYQLSKECNDGGACVGWLQTWGPGRHQHQQCDLNAMMSPDLFRKFGIPVMKKELSWLEYSIYHLDGPECAPHLDSILEMEELDVVEWISGYPIKPSNVASIPMFKKIQAAGKGLHLIARPEEVETLMSELSSKGLFMRIHTDTEQEARELLKKVEKWTRE